MPIYEYKCENCKLEFELLIFTGEEPVCPRCGSKKLERKVSLVTFRSTSTEGSSDSSFSSSDSSCSSCSSKNCSSCR